MQIKAKCKCGGEFYISIVDESVSTQMWITKKFDLTKKFDSFIELHKECNDPIIKELDLPPKEWQV